MATSGNREWADTEAKRRANAMRKSYAIYQHKKNGDCIIRARDALPPDPWTWSCAATVYADDLGN